MHAIFPRLFPKIVGFPEVLKNALKCTKMLNTTAGLGVKNILKKAPGHLSVTRVESLFYTNQGKVG